MLPQKRFASIFALLAVLVATVWGQIAWSISEIANDNGLVYTILDLLFLCFTGLCVYLIVLTLLRSNDNATDRQRATTFDLIERLASCASWRDDETGDHADRVGRYCSVIAKEMGWSFEDAQNIQYAGMLHDIGKIAGADEFSDEDSRVVQTHTLLGSEIFVGAEDPIQQMAHNITMAHHERWDGNGYPYGLKGEEIPIEGRIAAVAVVFDALSSKRRYKNECSFDESVVSIMSLAGTHFDPRVVDAFLTGMDEVKAIYLYGTFQQTELRKAA